MQIVKAYRNFRDIINSCQIDPLPILDLIGEINIWVDLTGGEFIVDTEMFRLGHKVKASDN